MMLGRHGCLIRRPFKTWEYHVISEMLSSGVPIRPCYARQLLPIVTRHADDLEAKAAQRSRRPLTWREHDPIMELGFDLREAREAEHGVRDRERRAEALERELGGGERAEEGEEGEEEE